MSNRTDELGDLARDLSARVAAYTPEWTEPSAGDPGITLVQLIGFLGESLLGRPELTAADRAGLREILLRLDRAVGPPCDDATLTRPTYYAGRLLDADDLRQEQEYLRSQRRRHNRLLHGIGVVRGLEVSLQPGPKGEGPTVVVSPGVAVSPVGDELVLCDFVILDPCSGPSPCYVAVALQERPVGLTADGEHDAVEETPVVRMADAIGPTELPIARLVRDGAGAWRLDPGMKPPRAGLSR